MTILAIDTSMAACSAALLLTEQVKSIQRCEPMARGHAEMIFPMISAVMAEGGCSFKALTKIAVTLGPGSFTGVRTGVAAARGLALAAGLPIAGVSTLEVMARGCGRQLGHAATPEDFAIAHDARRGEFYVQCFEANGNPFSEAQVLSSEDAVNALPTDIALLAGSGAPALLAEGERQGRSFRAVLPNLVPQAADLALLARHLEPQIQPPAPFYLRPPDAKPQNSKTLARMQ